MTPCLFVDITHGIDIDTFFKHMQQHALSHVFLDSDHSDAEMQLLLDYVKSYHMTIDMLHLPFRPNANDLYYDTPAGEDFFNHLKRSITLAQTYYIPTVVLHYGSKVPPDMNDLVIERIKTLLEMCHSSKITLCLENIRNQERLDTLYNLFKDDEYCGICFDCGHASCFTHSLETFPYASYDHKIKGIHMHDNDGLHDEHLVPFLGSIPYETVMKGLKKAHYEGPLILECMARDIHNSSDIDNYFNHIDYAFEALDNLWNNIQ